MERVVEQVQFYKHPPIKLKRVAAYARVSSGKDAMLHSLSAHVHRQGSRECAQPREVRLQPRDRQADENLRAVRERYRHGLVSHTEVLDAETLGSRAT